MQKSQLKKMRKLIFTEAKNHDIAYVWLQREILAPTVILLNAETAQFHFPMKIFIPILEVKMITLQ